MNNKLKTLLKTTAAVATLMMASQSWGAKLSDALNADSVSSAISVPANGFVILTATGAATVPYVGDGSGMTVGAGGTLALVIDPQVTTALTYADPLILNSNASVYLLRGASTGVFNLSGADVSSPINAAATGVNIYLTGATTLPDMSLMLGTKLNILNTLILTGLAAGFGGPIEIPAGKTLTQAVWTACGDLSGAGTLTAGNVDLTVNGNVSGTLTLTLSGMSGAGRKFTVTGNLETDKSFTGVPGTGTDGITVIRGNMVLSGASADFTTAGGVDIYGNLSVGHDTTVATATSLHVGGNAVFSGMFGIAGSGAASIDGTAIFTGSVTAASGVLSVRGATTLNGALTLSDACNLSLAGALSGSGALTLTGVTKAVSFGDASAYTGTVALGTAASSLTFAKTPKTTFTGHRGNLILTNGGTITQIASAGTSAKVTGGTGGDLVISEYVVPDNMAVTFLPGAGKKITVTNLTQDSGANEALTVAASTGSVVFSSEVKTNGATHTFNAPTSFKKYTIAGASTITANENMTIDELDLSAGAKPTFAIAAGKVVTVKKVTGSANIDISGTGTLSIKLSAAYSDIITAGTGILKTN